MKKTLLKNSFSGIIQLLITTILTLLTIPIFIHLLGETMYGLFAAISVIGNLNQFSNLGLNTTLTKFVAEQGKQRQSDHDIWVTVILLSAIIIPVSVFTVLFSKFLLIKILGIPIEYLDIGKKLFYLLIASNFLLLLGQCFVSVVNALQRMYISNIIRIVYSVSYWGLILLSLYLGYNLVEVGLAILIAATIHFLIIFYYFIKLWGIPQFGGLRHNFVKTVNKQLSYSMKIYSAGLLSFFFHPLTKILLSNYVGLAEVGYYDIALRIKNTALRILTKPMEALFPMQAHLKEFSRSRLLVHDTEQKSLYFIVPIIILLVFITKPLMNLWLGHTNDQVVLGTIWISIFYLIGLTTTPNYQFLFAKGYASKTIILQFANVTVNSLIFLLTYKNLGFNAAILSNCLAIASSFSLNLYFQNKYLNSMIFDSLNQIMRFLLATIIIAFVIYLVSLFVRKSLGQLQQIIVLTLSLMFSTILSYRFLDILTEEDIKRYFSFNSHIYKIINILFIR